MTDNFIIYRSGGENDGAKYLVKDVVECLETED